MQENICITKTLHSTSFQLVIFYFLNLISYMILMLCVSWICEYIFESAAEIYALRTPKLIVRFIKMSKTNRTCSIISDVRTLFLAKFQVLHRMDVISFGTSCTFYRKLLTTVNCMRNIHTWVCIWQLIRVYKSKFWNFSWIFLIQSLLVNKQCMYIKNKICLFLLLLKNAKLLIELRNKQENQIRT